VTDIQNLPSSLAFKESKYMRQLKRLLVWQGTDGFGSKWLAAAVVVVVVVVVARLEIT
jgi:hypothetical protein